jgi:hypothetical protein
MAAPSGRSRPRAGEAAGGAWCASAGARVSKKMRTAPGLAVAFAAACLVRLPLVLAGEVPLNDGGVFLAMATDPANARLAVPDFTSHNRAHIPFAYLPLGNFLTAAVAARVNVAFTHMHVSKGAAKRVAGIVPVAALGADSPFAAVYDGPGAAVFACRSGRGAGEAGIASQRPQFADQTSRVCPRSVVGSRAPPRPARDDETVPSRLNTSGRPLQKSRADDREGQDEHAEPPDTECRDLAQLGEAEAARR